MPGDLPPQFRPQPLQPRGQPVVPNLKAVGGLDNHAIRHRRIGGNSKIQRRTSGALHDFPGQCLTKCSVVGGGNFHHKIVSRHLTDGLGGQRNDDFAGIEFPHLQTAADFVADGFEQFLDARRPQSAGLDGNRGQDRFPPARGFRLGLLPFLAPDFFRLRRCSREKRRRFRLRRQLRR